MSSVSQLLTHPNLGFVQGAGPNFYLPHDHPHIHVGVNNAAAIVDSLAQVRERITFISLSWGGIAGGRRTINLYQRGPDEQLEQRTHDRRKKSNLEAALADHVGPGTSRAMQRSLNHLTQIGIDF